MLKRNVLGTLVVIAMLIEALKTSKPDKWKEYVKQYDLINSTTYIYYYQSNRNISEGFSANFKINGEVKTLEVAATTILLYIQDSKPYWFITNNFLLIYTYFAGSPMKISSLLEDGSIRVEYLGDKVDPLCKDLNCKREVALVGTASNKKEVIEPNGWSVILAVETPYTIGLGTKSSVADTEIRCKLRR